MNAALYIRVSTDEQSNEGYSIDAQRTLLLKKAEQLEYTIYDIYADEGFSAKSMRRPALSRMLKDVEAGKIQVVLFWRLDRFTRRSKDFQKMMELLIKYNAGIKSATENIDTTTAMGRFQLELTVSLAQLERETTSERVHFVMEDRHRKGLRNGAVSPYGYDLVKGKLVINPEEAEVVKRIFALYRQNHGCKYIAKLFNHEKIPKGNANVWAEFTVYYILTNPIYCGRLRWNYRKLSGVKTGKEIIVDGDHEPIITEEEFDQVQDMRELRARIGQKATSEFAFTGVIRCGRCGYGMTGSSQKRKNDRYRYYKCTGRFAYGICDMPIIAEDSIQEAFLHALVHPPDAEKYYVAAAEEVKIPSAQEQLTRELENIQKRRKKWQLAFANDVITLEELRGHTEDDRKREEDIREQLESLPEVFPKVHRSRVEIIELAKQLHDHWGNIQSEAAKKNFINEVFSYITINTDVTEAKGGPGRRVPVYVSDWDFNA